MAGPVDNPAQVERAEIVGALLGPQEVEAATAIAQQVERGLVDFFGNKSAVILWSNGAEPSGDYHRFVAAAGQIPRIYLAATAEQENYRGSSLQNVLQWARRLEAEAVIVIDGQATTVTPLWIKNLGEPIFAGFGLASPLYVRHKYDDLLATAISYPLTRALYGRRVRQVGASDFALSASLVEDCLQHPSLRTRAALEAPNLWLPTLAVVLGVPICQSFLGRPSRRAQGGALCSLEEFERICATIMELMGEFASHWTRVRWSKPTAVFGFGIGDVETPTPPEVATEEFHQAFLQGFEQHGHIWQTLLDSSIVAKLGEIKGLPLAHFDFPSELWARILYRYTVAFSSQAQGRESLLRSLFPLFAGKSLSYVKKTERMSTQQADEYVEHECMIFEELKPHLLREWQAREDAGH